MCLLFKNRILLFWMWRNAFCRSVASWENLEKYLLSSLSGICNGDFYGIYDVLHGVSIEQKPDKAHKTSFVLLLYCNYSGNIELSYKKLFTIRIWHFTSFVKEIARWQTPIYPSNNNRHRPSLMVK